MNLSAAAITQWHALMPAEIRAVIRNDACTRMDGAAARLVTDLTPSDSSGIADALVRHTGTITEFGTARRMRMLAWIATRTWGTKIGLAEILRQERLAALRPTIQHDLEALAGIVFARLNRSLALPRDPCFPQPEASAEKR